MLSNAPFNLSTSSGVLLKRAEEQTLLNVIKNTNNKNKFIFRFFHKIPPQIKI